MGRFHLHNPTMGAASAASALGGHKEDLSSLYRLPPRHVADRLEVAVAITWGRSDSSIINGNGADSGSRNRNRRHPSHAILPKSRAKIAMWLYDVADYLELDRECVAAAMGCVDRFMSGSSSGNGGTDGGSDLSAADGNRRRRRRRYRDLLRCVRSDATT